MLHKQIDRQPDRASRVTRPPRKGQHKTYKLSKKKSCLYREKILHTVRITNGTHLYLLLRQGGVAIVLSVCLFVCLYVILTVSRITHERVYGFRPNMVGVGDG